MTEPQNRADVVVVGSGVVGTSAAAALAQDGSRVLVLEAADSLGPGASTFNAGLLTPSHAGPWGVRRDVINGAKWLFRADSPFGVGLRPELARFFASLLAQSPASLATCLSVTRQMSLDSVGLHEALSQQIETGFVRNGLLDSYRTTAAFARARQAAERHAEGNVPCRVVSAEEARVLEPALAPGRAGGVLFEREAHLDPVKYLSSVAASAEQRGVNYQYGTRVLEVVRSRTGSFLVRTSAGDIHAGEVVIAAGAATPVLTRSLGTRLPIEPGTGYAVDLDSDQRGRLQRPLLLQEERVAVNPLPNGVRLAGTMAFSGRNAPFDARRVGGILAAGRAGLPDIGRAPMVRQGMGGRPCTPDGLPIVGRLRGGVIVASGHAMLGLTMAPLTALQICALVRGEDFQFSDALTPARYERR